MSSSIAARRIEGITASKQVLNSGKTRRKLSAGIWLTVALLIALAVSTVALWYASVAVEGNLFQTGTVSINLNDGVPVITEEEFLFEPGMTVVKDFFVKNESTIDVYYRIYFENVEGSAAEVLEITIKDGDSILYSGKASELTKEKAEALEDTLHVDETVWLTAEFHLPEDAGNIVQKTDMLFDICADAVQTRNNPDRLFE